MLVSGRLYRAVLLLVNLTGATRASQTWLTVVSTHNQTPVSRLMTDYTDMPNRPITVGIDAFFPEEICVR